MTGPETRPSPSANNDPGGIGSGRTGNGTTDLDLAVSDGGLDDWEYVKTLSASVSHRNNDGGGPPGPGATAMITVPTNFGNTPACSGDMGDYRRFSSADSTADETTEATRRLSRDTLATEASYLSSSSPRGSYGDGFGGTDGDLMSMLAAHQLQGGVTLGPGRGHNGSRDGIIAGGHHHPGDPNVLGLRRSAPPNMHGGRGELLVPPRPRRQRNKQTFAMKLWNLLESASDCGGAVRWMPNGSSFCVVDPDELVKRVLPRHFKEAKYTSFVSLLC